MKKVHLLLFLSVFLTFQNGYSTHQLIKQFELEMGLQIVLDTHFTDSWKSVDYLQIQDTVRLNNYLSILYDEYSKYPSSYFVDISVKTIVVCEGLKFIGQFRAAIPDPFQSTLLLSTNINYSKEYLIHVMHHELHHMTEYAIFGNMYFKWNKWNRKNKNKFKYGNGGVEAYKVENKYIDYYALNNPIPGFINLYSTTGQEEDRCEIVSLLMHDVEKQLLIKHLRDDRRLRRKTKLALKMLNSVSETEFLSWKDYKPSR